MAAPILVICCLHLHRAIREALDGTALFRVGVTASQLDPSSLTPLSVAVCGRLQLGASHWATSLASLQVVDNLVQILWYKILHFDAPGNTQSEIFLGFDEDFVHFSSDV